jgi:hypothetical protein
LLENTGPFPCPPKMEVRGTYFGNAPTQTLLIVKECWLGLSFQSGSVLRTGPMGALGPCLKWDAMGLKGFFQGLGHRVR